MHTWTRAEHADDATVYGARPTALATAGTAIGSVGQAGPRWGPHGFLSPLPPAGLSEGRPPAALAPKMLLLGARLGSSSGRGWLTRCWDDQRAPHQGTARAVCGALKAHFLFLSSSLLSQN